MFSVHLYFVDTFYFYRRQASESNRPISRLVARACTLFNTIVCFDIVFRGTPAREKLTYRRSVIREKTLQNSPGQISAERELFVCAVSTREKYD